TTMLQQHDNDTTPKAGGHWHSNFVSDDSLAIETSGKMIGWQVFEWNNRNTSGVVRPRSRLGVRPTELALSYNTEITLDHTARGPLPRGLLIVADAINNYGGLFWLRGNLVELISDPALAYSIANDSTANRIHIYYDATNDRYVARSMYTGGYSIRYT